MFSNKFVNYRQFNAVRSISNSLPRSLPDVRIYNYVSKLSTCEKSLSTILSIFTEAQMQIGNLNFYDSVIADIPHYFEKSYAVECPNIISVYYMINKGSKCLSALLSAIRNRDIRVVEMITYLHRIKYPNSKLLLNFPEILAFVEIIAKARKICFSRMDLLINSYYIELLKSELYFGDRNGLSYYYNIYDDVEYEIKIVKLINNYYEIDNLHIRESLILTTIVAELPNITSFYINKKCIDSAIIKQIIISPLNIIDQILNAQVIVQNNNTTRITNEPRNIITVNEYIKKYLSLENIIKSNWFHSYHKDIMKIIQNIERLIEIIEPSEQELISLCDMALRNGRLQMLPMFAKYLSEEDICALSLKYHLRENTSHNTDHIDHIYSTIRISHQ